MNKIYKILLIFLILQFSLFSACAESEENNVVAEEAAPIKILDNSAFSFEVLIEKPDTIDYHIFLSNDKSVEFITQYDYIFKIKSDTIDYKNIKSDYLGKFESDTILNLLVNNLKPKSDYYISAFTGDTTLIFSEKISTLIQKPNQQAIQLINTDATDKSVTVRWTKGNGQNRIVVIRKGEVPEPPKNGYDFEITTKYGDKTSEYGDGNFVVFDSKINDGNNITIENLKYDNYYVKVFEYNGEGEYKNYLTDDSKMNPVEVKPLLPPPANLTYEFSAGDTFTIKWEKLNDTAKYQFQMAHDKEFNNIIKKYDGLMIGNSNEWVVPVNVIENNVTYYRVRALYGNQKSNYSEYEEIKLK